VSDAALTSCIQELRDALRDEARQRKYIETLHRRGYRLLVPLVPVVPQSETPRPRRPCRLLKTHMSDSMVPRQEFITSARPS
jgi:DNA-binding winged helix-turn-helix (wHTH) protein